MKRIIIIILVLISLGTIIYYGQNSKKTNENELSFWTLQMGDFAPYINEVIREYESEHPNIHIKWTDVPFSEGEKRTLAAILSDNPPDLINLNPDFSAILAEKGALEPIEEEKLSSYIDGIIASLKYKEKIYAIPWYATSAITIYNKDLYKKSGYVTPPATYEKLGSLADVIKQKSNAFALMPTITENDTMLKILNKYGVNSAKTINSSQSQEVFAFYKDLYDKNLIPKESITQTQREALEKYMSGQVVFFQSGANFLNMIKENAPEVYENTDIAKQITGDLGQNDFSLMTLVVPLRAAKKAEAIDFALFLTNKENQLKLGKLTNVLATDKKALKNEFYTRYDKKDLIAKARCTSAKQLNKIEPVLRQKKGQKEINILINTAVQEILLNNADIEKTLNEVSKKWKELED